SGYSRAAAGGGGAGQRGVPAMSQTLENRLLAMLEVVYPALDYEFLTDQLLDAMGLEPEAEPPPAHQNNWSEADVVLITYADTVQRLDEKPLVTLKRFLDDCLRESIT